MADSLDDFFAKKDKKRGKDKSKTAALSAEALVKELEEGAKQIDYAPRKEAKPSATLEMLGLDANDADWKDFEEVEKRDYTGLKVREMSIQDQEDEQRKLSAELIEHVPEVAAWRKDKEVVPDVNTVVYPPTQDPSSSDATPSTIDSTFTTDEAEAKTANPDGQQPIDQSASTMSGEQEPAAKSSSEEKKSDETSAKKKYVPPSMKNLPGSDRFDSLRGSGEVKVLEPVKMSKLKGHTIRGNAAIPDIQDEKSFPSLG